MNKNCYILFTLLISCSILSACSTGQIISKNNIASINQVARIDVEYPAEMTWSPDSSILYSYSYNSVDQIDINTRTLTVHRSTVEGGYILDINGEKGLYLESADNISFEIKSIESGELLQTIEYPTYASSAVFSPDGASVAIASDEAWLVDIFDTETGGLIDTLIGFETASPVYGVQYSRDGGSLLYFARAALQPQDISSHVMGAEIFHEDFISTFTSSPDGSKIATAAAGMYNEEFTSLVYLWDRADGSQIAVIPVDPYVTAMDYTPDGKILVFVGGSLLYFVQSDTLELISTLETSLESISAVSVSPDGTLLAVADSAGGITLWGMPGQ